MDKKILVILGLIVISIFLIWGLRSFNFLRFLRQGGRFIGKEQAFCYDTDDGLSFYERGMIYGRLSTGIEFKYFDLCEDDSKLEEWQCINLEPVSGSHDCPRGCINGACKI